MKTVQINIERIDYLLDMFNWSRKHLLDLLNKKRKRLLSEADIFNKEIKFSTLKQIDAYFKVGYVFYMEPEPIENKEGRSIFFRKSGLNEDLSLGAKQRVLECERHYTYLKSLETLASYPIARALRSYSINDDPIQTAREIASKLPPPLVSKSVTRRERLKRLIITLSNAGVYIYEFIDTANKIEKANIDGVFLSPNFIALKRENDAVLFSREIFTLAHEFGHYLLNEEQAESVDFIDDVSNSPEDEIESWCDTFAFYYLLGDYADTYQGLENASAINDYHHDFVDEVYARTGLSKRAVFYNLYKNKRLSLDAYREVKKDLDAEVELARAERKQLFENSTGTPRAAKPIKSPLVQEIAEVSYLSGIMNIVDFEKLSGYSIEKINAEF